MNQPYVKQQLPGFDQPHLCYNLTLGADSVDFSHERGWFHFKVSNVRVGTKIRFRLLGLTMNPKVFNEGMEPVFQDQIMGPANAWLPVHNFMV